MAERIYTRSGKGLEPLEEHPFKDENELQKLIADYPQLLDGEQMRPRDPRRWILIRREQGIAEGPSQPDRWSVDHLIIDQDAMPTLVEVKRSSNTEIRRTVVGQLLEYAAHASQTWSAEELRQTFEDSAGARDNNPDSELAALLLSDSEPDADKFWEQVATNLAARRLRLLFVADEIPDELARVTEFLNEQMHDIEVLAVEIKQFKGAGGQALVPRVIGRIAAPIKPGGRESLTLESFLGHLPDEDAREAASRLLDTAKSSGDTIGWGTSSVMIRMRCSDRNTPISVAWLHLPSTSPQQWIAKRPSFGSGGFFFGATTHYWDQLSESEVPSVLERWASRFESDGFAENASSEGGTSIVWAVDYASAAANIELIVRRLADLRAEMRGL